MSSSTRVAIVSKSFSQNKTLRAETLALFPTTKFNDTGRDLRGDGLVSFLADAERVVVGTEEFGEAEISRLPLLKVVSKYGVGLNNVSLPAMETRGIRFWWKGGINKRSVAELTICLTLSLLRHVGRTQIDLKQGKWNKMTGALLTGRTVGIIGCGHIGKDLVSLLSPFGCRILVNDIRDYANFYRQHDIEPVTLDVLLSKADIVTVHTPLNKTTRGLINAERLAKMQPHALLINTARGGIVDEADLAAALKTGKIAGAALDVFVTEPLEKSDLLALPNFLGTPHLAGSAVEAVLAMGRSAIEGLSRAVLIADFLRENPEAVEA